MKSIDAARLQNDIQKSVNVIGELVRDGVGSNEINTFYADKIQEQLKKIQKILDNMEY